MSESNFASLNPSLLARKGGARPAMKPQLGPVLPADNLAHNLEDLGWNDMGKDGEQSHGADHKAEIVQIDSAKAEDTGTRNRNDNEVRRQQQKIAEQVEKSISTIPSKKRRSAFEQGKRAAFTLRLDAERHLKLRLASTIRNRSAQQVVTEALDALLGDMPELESLAAQVKRR